MSSNYQDVDPEETQEWEGAINDVLRKDGAERAGYLIKKINSLVGTKLSASGESFQSGPVNTISKEEQVPFNGDFELEDRITNISRWNTMAMVTKANKESDGIGGHIATFTSVATLYEVGINHFFRGQKGEDVGDMVFFQGHSAPGIYARAYLEGIISEEKIRGFRREFKQGGGLPSYPHPRLTEHFWQFPTVSMGLGPILSLYVARFNKYLEHRGIKNTSKSRVWAFLGDGELGEVEVYGSIPTAVKEKLDNLIYVINCNLQRLDGPVYGNGSILREAEGMFRGAGWNVIKVIWSSEWDKVFAEDKEGLLSQFIANIPDGDLQGLALKNGEELREFFSQDPQIKHLVDQLTDEEFDNFEWGGNDSQKVYAAYHKAVNMNNGRPTVILAQTTKGYGMGKLAKGRNTAHQQKKMDNDSTLGFIKDSGLPISEKDALEYKLYHPGKDSEELKYIQERRKELGHFNPHRMEIEDAQPLPQFSKGLFDKSLMGSGERSFSTTKAFVQVLSNLLRDKEISKHIVPIICDEARTFGLEGVIGQYGIYNVGGQKYTPVDKGSLTPYKEKTDGVVLQEGINEAGSLASFIAAGSSYSYQGIPMVPFYSFYSMFGVQRVGDSIWQSTDMRCKGFLMGGTAGRTTLNGEGLQHEDGHSVVMASIYPTLKVYDPAFEYEMALVIKTGIEKMYYQKEDCLYYVTMYNQETKHPAMPKGVKEEDVVNGLYLYDKSSDKPDINLISSGISMQDAIEAKLILEKDYNLKANLYSAPSFKTLRDEALKVERENLMNPGKKPQVSHVEKVLKGQSAPFISVTDYVRAWSELIRPWVPGRYVTLGTDGFGHSSSREELRNHFETDTKHVVYTCLYALFLEGAFKAEELVKAQKNLGINPDKYCGLDDITV